jgi:hypothetical protein
MTNNFPVLDNGILGVKDDGSPEGILKVKIDILMITNEESLALEKMLKEKIIRLEF